jgi:phosphopantetheine--protein transferase-like protein
VGLPQAMQRMRALMDAARRGGGGVIIGIGSDLCDIRRIEKSLERFGERFTHKVFTEIERKRSERKPDRASSYAKRFAAKEACSKALGTGLKRGVHLARHGRGEPAVRQADHGADRRRGRPTGRDGRPRA